MTWCDFLAFMQTIRGVADIALGIGLSYLVEAWPKFETLSAMQKRFTIMGICVGVPLLALGLAWLTGCNAQPSGEDVWQAVLAGSLAFGASQWAHARELGK
jgi:hypothetical protein